jgi:hypothetical protein
MTAQLALELWLSLLPVLVIGGVAAVGMWTLRKG